MSTLYNALRDHFNLAALQHPQHKDTFMAELQLYKKALMDKDPTSVRVLKMSATPLMAQFDLLMGDKTDGPREVNDVCNAALRMYRYGKDRG